MVKEWVMTKQAIVHIKIMKAVKQKDPNPMGRRKKGFVDQLTAPAQQVARREMIAREAYLLAARRNFQGGDPVIDWLEAEVKIDQVMNA